MHNFFKPKQAKMCVAHFYANDLRYASRLAWELSQLKEQYQLRLYVTQNSENNVSVDDFSALYPNVDIVCYKRSDAILSKIVAYTKLIIKLIADSREKKIKMLHAHTNRSLIVIFFWSIFTGLPYIYETRDLTLHTLKGEPLPNETKLDRIKRKIEAYIVKKCNMVVHVSEPFLQVYAYLYPGIKQCVIETNTLSIKPVSPSEKNKLEIVYFGKININRIPLELCHYISLNSEKFILRIFGYPTDQTAATYLETVSGLSGISYEGRYDVNSLSSKITEADISIIPLNVEIDNFQIALPNKFFQSLELGLPVLTSNTSVLSKVIKENKLGWINYDQKDWSILEEIFSLKKENKLDEFRIAVSRYCEFRSKTNKQGETLHKIYENILGHHKEVASV